jgi:hypothetical protein
VSGPNGLRFSRAARTREGSTYAQKTLPRQPTEARVDSMPLGRQVRIDRHLTARPGQLPGHQNGRLFRASDPGKEALRPPRHEVDTAIDGDAHLGTGRSIAHSCVLPDGWKER